MKLFSRDFTRTEKLLIVVLALVLVGLAYYQFIDRPARTAVANAESEAKILQTEIDIAQAEAMKLRAIQDNLDQLMEEKKMAWMPSYNASKPEIAFLNDVLSDTLSYAVSFDSVTRNDNQIRRRFKLKYSTGGYRAAREIIERLRAGDYRCIVGDVNCAIGAAGLTTVTASATFYETMVGGTADAGLPADSAAVNR